MRVHKYIKKLQPLVLWVLVGMISMQQVFAISSSDLNSILSRSELYQQGVACSGLGSTPLIGNDNETQIYNFFIGKGLSQVATAAILGNFDDESGFNPEDSQTDEKSHANPYDSGSLGWGLAQWTPGSKVLTEAHTYGITGNIDLLPTQLDLIWAEMQHTSPTSFSDLAAAMKQFTNPSQIDAAATFFSSGFEGGVAGNRIADAEKALQKYKNYTSPGNPAPPSPGCPVTGQATQFINGFTIYSQYDPRWADKPYGDTTISVAGCGPSAMAMIITALTGNPVTPDQTASYADSQHQYVIGQGSAWTIAPVLAAHWGLKATAIGADQGKIVTALTAGGLVIASGQGPLPFTHGGHYLVIRGIASDGKWYVGDSGHDNTSSKEWDPNQLLASMNGGSVYAITQ